MLGLWLLAVPAQAQVALQLDRAYAEPGTTFEATGDGFTSGATVQLRLQNRSGVNLLLDEVVVGRLGTFTQELTAPDVAPGPYEVLAAEGATIARADLNIIAFAVFPSAGKPGAPLRLAGEGLPAGEPFDLRLLEAPFLIEATDADGAGAFLVDTVVPDVAPGPYTAGLQVGGDTVATRPFEVLPPLRLSLTPTEGPLGTSVEAIVTEIVPGGTLQIRLDGYSVYGPETVEGTLLTANFDAVGFVSNNATVEAINRVGGQVVGTASAPFTRLPTVNTEVSFRELAVPPDPIVPGEQFTVTGFIDVPDNENPEDYELTLVWITPQALVPVNRQSASILPDGAFEISGVGPSLLQGFAYASWANGDEPGQTDELGLVYKNPKTGRFGSTNLGPAELDPLNTQDFTIRVVDGAGQPISNATVAVSHTAPLLPEGENPESLADFIEDEETITWEKPLAAGFIYNDGQLADAIEQITTVVPVNGCPVTLANQATDEAGEISFSVAADLLEFLAKGIFRLNKLDINTVFSSPGPATFRVRVAALHLGYGDANVDGICTARVFEFQKKFEGGWYLRDGPGGDFTVPFDPNQPLVVTLGACSGPLQFPARPQVPGLPPPKPTIQSTGLSGVVFEGLRSYAHVDPGVNLIVEKPVTIRLDHDAAVLGTPDNVMVTLGSQTYGPLGPQETVCGGDQVRYETTLPGIEVASPGALSGSFTGTLDVQGTPQIITRPFTLLIDQGPEWIADPQPYESRVILWEPGSETLTGVETMRDNPISADTQNDDVGTLSSDNQASGTVRQVFTPFSSSKTRTYDTSSTVADNPPDNEVGGKSEINGTSVAFGPNKYIGILDTGKIPLFRYAWGIPPLAAATVGSDIRFTASYFYGGIIQFTPQAVNTSVTAATLGEAELTLFFDFSAVLGLVSMNFSAIPSIAVGMPIVVVNNVLDTDQSQPCFRFNLDVAYSVKVGICPLCVGGDGFANLISAQEGSSSGCNALPESFSPLLATTDRNGLKPGGGERVEFAPPSPEPTAVDTDGDGTVAVLLADEVAGFKAQFYEAGLPAAAQVISDGVGVSQPDIAFYDTDKAVIVWAESSLDEAAFLALGDPTTVLPSQHMHYRTVDENGVGPIMELTPPNTGEGGVVLAACRNGEPGCPAGGEVLAVWGRDRSADISQHDFELYYAFFDGVGWTLPMPLDATTTAKDSQPAPAYVFGQPVVAWVRNDAVDRSAPITEENPTGIELNLMQRRFVYRFLDEAAGVQDAIGLPTGVAWPSLAGGPSGELVLAFTRATEPGAFIGSRQAIDTAIGRDCVAGVCTWDDLTVQDLALRDVYGEKPRLFVDGDGQVTLLFRYLGFSGDPLPTDPIGAIMGTGDVGEITFALPAVNETAVGSEVIAITQDGAVNWQLDAVIDPYSNSMLTSFSKAQVVSTAMADALGKTTGTPPRVALNELGGGVVLAATPMLPDFNLLDAKASAPYIAEGSSIFVDVALRNDGVDWGEGTVSLVATWDGPAGVGLQAASLEIADLVPAATAQVPLEIGLPPGFSPDEEHTLTLTVNPGQPIEEASGANNTFDLKIGTLPPPELVSVTWDPASTLVFMSWTPPADPRVTGYRIYRRLEGGGAPIAVGTSYKPGYVDLSAIPGQRYEYTVTSMSDGLVESVPSEVATLSSLMDLLFRDGFEQAMP